MSRLTQLLVSEVEERLPVLAGHGVLAGPDEVPESAVNQLAERGDLLGLETANGEEAVHRVRCLEDLELSVRVRPKIFLGVGKQDRPRSTQSDETVLVEGEPRRVIVELFEAGIEPMWEAGVDAQHALRLVDLAADRATRGGPPATGLVGNGQRDPLVERGR